MTSHAILLHARATRWSAHRTNNPAEHPCTQTQQHAKIGIPMPTTPNNMRRGEAPMHNRCRAHATRKNAHAQTQVTRAHARSESPVRTLSTKIQGDKRRARVGHRIIEEPVFMRTQRANPHEHTCAQYYAMGRAPMHACRLAGTAAGHA